MMTKTVVVINYQNGVAQVRCQRRSACDSCVAKSACGNDVLNELSPQKSDFLLQIESITPLKIGQIIEIGLPEKSFLHSVALAYLFPLIILLCTTFLSEIFIDNELFRAFLVIFNTALSFLFIRIYAKKIQKKSAYKPILLRVLN